MAEPIDPVEAEQDQERKPVIPRALSPEEQIIEAERRHNSVEGGEVACSD